MIDQDIVLVLDAGNTALKIGVYQNDELISVQRFDLKNISEIKTFYNQFKNPKSILSSVLSLQSTQLIIDIFQDCILVNKDTRFPICFNYKTIGTLGIDRVCNVIEAFYKLPNKSAVTIDLGTCIKFDFIDKDGVYQGGSISPGIALRYKSLNDYTSNLPLIIEPIKSELIGKSTIESIQSGVMNGIEAEINQFIERYSKEYSDLTFFMTGGDLHYFDFPLKNNIFVDENLTLNGLYQIYLFNAH